MLVGVGLFAVYAAAPLWLVLLCYRSFRLAWSKHVVQILIFGAGWLLIFLAGKYDPTPFTYWFLD